MERLPGMRCEGAMGIAAMIDKGIDERMLAAITSESRRCSSSRAYPTEWRASRAVDGIERTGRTARCYRCRVCGRWHVEETGCS